MSKEVEEAIEKLKYYINLLDFRPKENPDSPLELTRYFDEWKQVLETVLNYIKELEEERDGIYADYQDLGKAYYDSIPKQKIRDKILYYKSFGIQKVNNGLIGEKFSEWTEYVMQDEIDILNELLEEDV